MDKRRKNNQKIIFINLAFSLIFVLGLGFYILSLSSNSSVNFSLRFFEEKLLELKLKNENLQLEFSRLALADNLLREAESRGMVATGPIKYLEKKNLSLR